MENVYLTCLIGGILFALVSLIFGDWLSHAFDGVLGFLSADTVTFLHPMTLIGGITIFGGAGIMLTRYSILDMVIVSILSLFIAIAASFAVHYLYVKPMEDSENSIAFTFSALSGSLAEVITSIPADGYGEVLVRVGAAGVTNQIAASFDQVAVPTGSQVVVVEVKDHVLYVSLVNLSIS